MTTPNQRPTLAKGRWMLPTGFILLGLFAAMTILQARTRDTQFADAKEIEKLTQTKLTQTPRSSDTHDWPEWRGPRRDGISTETGLDLPKPAFKQVWEKPIGKGYSTCSVSQGKLFTLEQRDKSEVLLCLNADNGEKLWEFAYPAQYRNEFGDGPRATPTVDGNLVFIVGGTGLLHCVQVDTGSPLWSKDLLKEYGASNLRWGVSFSPLVVGDRLFVTPGGPNGKSVVALEKTTGKQLWTALDDPSGYSSPVAANLCGAPQVVFFLEQGLAGIEAETGKVLWRHHWETSYGCNIATPIVVDDYVFISSGYRAGCTLVKIEKTDAGLAAKTVYKNKKMCNHFATSVRWNDLIFGFNDSVFTCMDFRTGEVKWTQRGFDKGTLLAVDGWLIILGEYGQLAIAEATGEEYREMASMRFSEKRCWPSPVLANGRLYLRDEGKLACYDLRK